MNGIRMKSEEFHPLSLRNIKTDLWSASTEVLIFKLPYVYAKLTRPLVWALTALMKDVFTFLILATIGGILLALGSAEWVASLLGPSWGVYFLKLSKRVLVLIRASTTLTLLSFTGSQDFTNPSLSAAVACAHLHWLLPPYISRTLSRQLTPTDQ